MEGWIKLHRNITENGLYFAERFTRMQAWIDLLLLAHHKGSTVFIHGIEITLEPGSLCYSQLTLAERWQWNFKSVRKFLFWLENHKMVETKTSNLTTIISIVKWKEYQFSGEQKGERKESRTETNKNEKNGKKRLHSAIYSLLVNITGTGNSEAALQALAGKFTNELGEKEFFKILTSLVSREMVFENERTLAAYLTTCKQNAIPAKKHEPFIDTVHSDPKFHEWLRRRSSDGEKKQESIIAHSKADRKDEE